MKKLIGTVLILGSMCPVIAQYSTCATAAGLGGTPLSNGGCLTNQSFPGSVNMAGICLGGSNPAVYVPFIAGSCSQFTINPDFSLNPSGSSFGYTVLTTGCANALAVTECVGNIVQDQDFTISGISYNGGLQLTPGTKYVLRLYGAVGANTLDICYNANTPEEASNECVGAVGLGSSPTTYFNGGDCSYNGTYDDTPSNPSFDGAASLYCAGSLENTQWVSFAPLAGASSIQVIGSNINCTGGACAYQFGVFSGVCGSLVNEGCVSNGSPCASGPDPNTALTTAGGNVLVWNATGPTGFTTTISPPSGFFNGTEVFYLAMDGNADAQCYYTLQGVNVQPILLPIELLSFNAVKYDKANVISWEVASEFNNSYFTLEKSEDGDYWETTKIIEGAGTSLTKKKYSTMDTGIRPIINYYRLKQTDFDGTSVHSHAIAVDNRISAIEILSIHNLLGDEVSLDYAGIKIVRYKDGTFRKQY